MRSFIPITVVTLYGVSLRITFGFLNDFMEVMGASFLIAAPFIVGFLTVILQPKAKELSGGQAFFFPWITSLAILGITILTNLEGTICWILLFPLFAILAGFGGLLANYFRRSNKQKQNNSISISIIALLPLVLGFVEGENASSKQYLEIKESKIIEGNTTDAWNQITANSENNENNYFILNFLDFPKHTKTTLDKKEVGGTRMVYYDRDLYFKESIVELEEEKLLRLQIDIDPEKVPATVMDEHILIGGKHLDIMEDKWELEDLGNGKVKVSISSKFMINTPLNWYSGIWSKYLMSSILNNELNRITG